MDRRRVVEVQVGEFLLEDFRRLERVVVRDGVVDVMRNVRTSDAVVQKVENRAIWSIDGHKRALRPCPLLVEVWNINIGVL